MFIIVSMGGKKRRVKVNKAVTISQFLEEIGINPVTVLVKINGNIVPDDMKLKQGDPLEIIRIVSRG